MNVKKSLENRIRGWLPQEANVSKGPTKMDLRIKGPFNNSNQLGKGNVRTIKAIALFSSIFIMFTVTAMLLFAMVGIVFIAVAILFGLGFGLFSGVLVTPRILKRTENHQDSWGWKEFLCLMPATIFFVLTLPDSIFAGFYVGSLAITFLLTQFILFLLYERKNKVVIIQKGWTGNVNSIVPQTNPSNPVPRDTETIAVSQKVKWTTRLGFSGGFFFVLFSILQLANYKEGLFYWNASLVSGSIILFSAIIGLAAGFIGAYGSFIGKKKGGSIMLASGIIGLICAPFYGIVSGSLLIVGGTIACLEKPLVSPTVG
jgi:MFS family permease